MRFLVLQHKPHEGPGRYAQFAKDAGIQLNTIKLWEPDYRMPTPSQYKGYDAAIIMGGPQGVNDSVKNYPSKDDELRFIESFNGPMLGHCLGSQLGGCAFGGNVYRDNRKECGFYPVRLANAKINSLFKGFNETFPVFHWHGDSFEIPEGAVPLVYSQYDPPAVQAFQYDRFFGVLFHMEMTKEMIATLLKVDKDWFDTNDREINHGNSAKSILEKAAKLDVQMERQARTLFYNFVSMVDSRVYL